MASISSSSFTTIRYTLESNAEEPGYNAGDDLREIPFAGESLKFSTQFLESKRINKIRQLLDNVQSGYEVNGGLKIEFASKIYDEFIQGSIWGLWQNIGKATTYTLSFQAASAGVHGGIISDDNTSNTIITGLIDNQWFYLRSEVSANSGIYKIKTISNNSIVLDESTPISNIETGKICKICASMMRAPKDGQPINMRRHKFFIERQHVDMNPKQFFSYEGNLINTFSLNGMTASNMTGSFDFVGKNTSIYNADDYDAVNNPNGNGVGSIADVNGDSQLDALEFNGFNTISHVKGIYIDGVNVNRADGGDLYVQSLGFTIGNSLRGAKAIGYKGNIHIQAGRLRAKGALSAYFSNDKLYRKYIDGNEFELSYVIENDNNEAYVFTFPRVKFIASAVNVGGRDQDLIEKLEWQAMYDKTLGTSIQIDRLYDSYTDIFGDAYTDIFGDEVVLNSGSMVTNNGNAVASMSTYINY